MGIQLLVVVIGLTNYGDGSMGLTVGFSNNDDGAGTTSSDKIVAYGNF